MKNLNYSFNSSNYKSRFHFDIEMAIMRLLLVASILLIAYIILLIYLAMDK